MNIHNTTRPSLSTNLVSQISTALSSSLQISASSSGSDYFQERTVVAITSSEAKERIQSLRNVPEAFICPITHELMEEPYTNELGHTYERYVLERLLRDKKPDPLTQKVFKHIFPNYKVKQIIEDWKEQQFELIQPGFPYMQDKSIDIGKKYICLGQEFESEGNLLEAEENYKKALKYSDRPEAYEPYALLHIKVSNSEKAYRALFILAKLYKKNDQLIEAKRSYELAKEIMPEKEAVFQELIQICQALNLKETTIQLLKEQGSLYEKKKALEYACKSYAAAYELSQETGLLKYISELYKAYGLTEQAFKYGSLFFEERIQKEPEIIGIYKEYIQFLKDNHPEKVTDIERRFSQILEVNLKDKDIQIIPLPKYPHRTHLSFYNRSILGGKDLQEAVNSCPNIIELNLHNCYGLNGADLEHLKGLTKLQTLIMSCCRSLPMEGLKHLKNLASLTSLNLRKCYLSEGGEELVYLSALPKLQLLDLSDIYFSGFSEKEYQWTHIEKLKNLKGLILNAIKASSIEKLSTHLSALPKLESLELSCHCYSFGSFKASNNCNCINDESLLSLKKLIKLKSLRLNGCEGITDQGKALLKRYLLNVKIEYVQ